MYGQRSLVVCSPWGHEESDTTERLHFHIHKIVIQVIFIYLQEYREGLDFLDDFVDQQEVFNLLKNTIQVQEIWNNILTFKWTHYFNVCYYHKKLGNGNFMNI